MAQGDAFRRVARDGDRDQYGRSIPAGTELVSIPGIVDRYGIDGALVVMFKSGFSGPKAVAELRRAGVSDIDLEAALLRYETEDD